MRNTKTNDLLALTIVLILIISQIDCSRTIKLKIKKEKSKVK